MPRRLTDEERLTQFWAYINKTKTGCWYWVGTQKPSDGYGRTSLYPRVSTLPHRVMFWLEHGYLPKVVRHTCDRGHKGCVNPLHLEAGTQKENFNDWRTRNPEAYARFREGCKACIRVGNTYNHATGPRKRKELA